MDIHQQKQTLFKQGVNIEKILYSNFDDDLFFDLQANILETILDLYFEIYSNYNDDFNLHFFFDEIHEITILGNFIHCLLDTKNIKIYLSDSSSMIINKEISTTLLCSALVRMIFPFSFS
jgi:predicted AAA+ superfamily ATPase